MAKNDRLCIKINDNLTIAASDLRNVEVRLKVPKKGDTKTMMSKVGYAPNLKAAILLAAKEVPSYSEAKKLDQLKADYEAFIDQVEKVVEQYKLPDSALMLGKSKEIPVGLYGKDFRGEDDSFVVEKGDEEVPSEDVFPETDFDDFEDDEFESGDDFDDWG